MRSRKEHLNEVQQRHLSTTTTAPPDEPNQSRVRTVRLRVNLPGCWPALPLEQLRVRVRREGARRIRGLMQDGVDLECFNQAVWCFEHKTVLDGEDVTGMLFAEKDMEERDIARFHQALDQGSLDLCGNYTWGSATIPGDRQPRPSPQ